MSDLETVSWVSARGAVVAFNGAGATDIRIPQGPAGRHMPAYDIATQQLAGAGESRITSIRPKPRTVTIPLEVTGTDLLDVRARVRALARTLDPTAGPGQLRFTMPDGTVRVLSCVYQAGAEGDDSTTDPAQVSVILNAQFLAVDPYFRADIEATSTWALDPSAGSFFPFFPLRLGTSQIFNRGNLDSLSDIRTWPFWTIQGPGSQLVLQNDTTGKTLTWGGTLGAGELLYIDTRPPELSNDPKSVRDALGTWRFAELVWPSSFWPLEPGTNFVRIELTGATAASLVALRWLPRYLGA